MPRAVSCDYSDEHYRAGDLVDVDDAEVRSLLEVDGVRAFFWVGPLSCTLPTVGDVPPLSLTHVDADLHESVIEACQRGYPPTGSGGVIVFDDYDDRDCPGATRAITEFFGSRSESPVVLPSGQAIVVKQAEGS